MCFWGCQDPQKTFCREDFFEWSHYSPNWSWVVHGSSEADSETCHSPSMCPLSEPLKVTTSYKRPSGGLWRYRDLITLRVRKSFRPLLGMQMNETPCDSCNKRLLSFCKTFKCHLAISLTSAGTEKQLPHCLLHYCLPPPTFLSPPPWQKAPTLSYGDRQKQSSLLNRFSLVLVNSIFRNSFSSTGAVVFSSQLSKCQLEGV